MKSRHYTLSATKRERAGKGVARALRREHKIPAVIYGDHKDTLSIALDSNILNLEYRKGHMMTWLCDMDVAGERHLVLARDVQTHPVTDNVIHADFLRVTPKTKITVMVPVRFIGHEDCPGLRDKGILNVAHHELEMMCIATDIPDHIDVSLAGKNIGDAIKIGDAQLPVGAKPVDDDPAMTIAALVAPKTAEQEAAEEAEAAAATAAATAAAAAEAAAPAEGAAAAPGAPGAATAAGAPAAGGKAPAAAAPAAKAPAPKGKG